MSQGGKFYWNGRPINFGANQQAVLRPISPHRTIYLGEVNRRILGEVRLAQHEGRLRLSEDSWSFVAPRIAGSGLMHVVQRYVLADHMLKHSGAASIHLVDVICRTDHGQTISRAFMQKLKP